MNAERDAKGLEASIWAPKGDGLTQYTPRAGDWTCLSCRFSNFASRQVCLRCSLSKEESIRNVQHGYSSHRNGVHEVNLKPGTITEPSTPNLFLGENSVQPTHHTHVHPHVAGGSSGPGSKPMHTGPTILDRFDSQKHGLSTSRWAPRNANQWAAGSEGPEIWTRTVPVTMPKLEPNDDAPHSSKPQDLGLPYEVQHYILTMTQRILEEGCYDFASRWIPSTLKEKNYTCSEAVELSEWKRVLPELIPNKAINPVSNYKLEAALTDAVRTRNSAVHRHLCDNSEIRKMAWRAQDLMFMFSDVTRQNKFHQLRIELDEWDRLNSSGDSQTARGRLQSVLQEISERPVDDMDWTPNAMSLQEIGSETVSGSLRELDEKTQASQHFGDEMELD